MSLPPPVANHRPILRGLLLIATLLSAAGCGAVAQNRNAAGIRYFNRGQIAAAQARFEQAKNANPQNADAYYNLGALAHMQGLRTRDPVQLAPAESYYKQALTNNPNHVDAHRALAVLLAQTQRVDQSFAL